MAAMGAPVMDSAPGAQRWFFDAWARFYDLQYVWVDGVHFDVRLEDDRLCTLVMIGVRDRPR
jgi:hypothetical protein